MTRYAYVTLPGRPYVLILNLGEFDLKKLTAWMDFYQELYPEHEVELWDAFSLGTIDRAREAAELLQGCQIDLLVALHDPEVPDREYLLKMAFSEWKLPGSPADVVWQQVK